MNRHYFSDEYEHDIMLTSSTPSEMKEHGCYTVLLTARGKDHDLDEDTCRKMGKTLLLMADKIAKAKKDTPDG